MTFSNRLASVFVPDGTPVETAFKRISHLGVGAHQDDLEIMAFHGILECYRKPDRHFGAVTCTSGGGSPRSGPYAGYSDEDMAKLRRTEQEKAATVGEYGVLVQLNHASAVVKDPGNPALTDDLGHILTLCRPSVVYTHNPADKHETHVSIVLAVLAALRARPAGGGPSRVYGCEVWRGLDWLDDNDKVPLDVSGRDHLAAGLVGIYDSQIAGGKRYDLATLGRRRANASYFQAHGTDESEELWFAMDLTPLVADPTRDIVGFVLDHIEKFKADVAAKLKAHLRTR
jgi:LmbE family N-acetylglucosaminyl deacetylase